MKRFDDAEPEVIAMEDVLADVLARTPLGGGFSAHAELGAPWSIRFPARGRSGLHIVTRGNCFLRVAGESGARELQRGDLVLLPHGSSHVLSTTRRGPAPTFLELLKQPSTHYEDGVIRGGGDGPTTSLICGVYVFDEPETHPVLALLPSVVHVRGEESGEHEHIVSAVQLLARELGRGGAGGRTVLSRLLDVLFVYAVRAWAEAQPEGTAGWLGALRDKNIGRALAAIHRPQSWPLSVDDLAREARLSRAAFKRRFTALVGESPRDYMNAVRMDHASRLLRRSDASIAEIAAQIGYESEYAFAKAFKRIKGLAPGRFRASGAAAR